MKEGDKVSPKQLADNLKKVIKYKCKIHAISERLKESNVGDYFDNGELETNDIIVHDGWYMKENNLYNSSGQVISKEFQDGCVFVNQRAYGYEGDGWEGEMYFDLQDGTFAQISFCI